MRQTNNECLNRVDKRFMRKIVGRYAVRRLKEFPDGSIKGYILTVHLNQIMRAYRERANSFKQKYDIEEYSSGFNTGLSHFEIIPQHKVKNNHV